MNSERVIVVAVEDQNTAPIVAAEAARIAAERDTRIVVLLHVRERHPVISAIFSAVGYTYVPPVMESEEDGMQLLDLAERALRAACAALGQPLPVIRRVLAEGDVTNAIELVVAEHQAEGIVLGARRSHAFGGRFHHDVRARVAAHLRAPLHLAAQPPERRVGQMTA
ncbi:MAG TPA: universal stress protein [Chloroflexota bacterium]|nr:universal stress protein [Chloroflexota bacterium]